MAQIHIAVFTQLMLSEHAQLTAVGFEPTPFRNGALSHRLRPLGQTVLKALHAFEMIRGGRPEQIGDDGSGLGRIKPLMS